MALSLVGTKVARDRIAAVETGSPYDGVILEYTNPRDGGPVMPTIACYVQVLKPGQRTESHRQTCSTVYHVIQGQGATIVNGERISWDAKDIFTVPNWARHEHVNESPTQPSYLFSYTDEPVYRALGLYREDV